MKFAKVILIISLLVPMMTNAQKIKYKELFPLLNSKLYTPENKAKLNTFLAAQNKPHPNGNLQMALIYEDRFYKLDILDDTTKINLVGDSAISQLKLAIQLITEKEIKKNDQYYQSFYRRDLRTGEFGIKISDVHLDLEKKIEAIQNKVKGIRALNTLLLRIQGRNNLSASIYKQMVEKGGTMRELLFALTDEDMTLLDQVLANARGLYVLADDLKESAMELGSNYYQAFNTFKIIETYGVDGLEQSDVFAGELDLWDYETWAKMVKDEYAAVKMYKASISQKENAINQAFDQVAQGLDPGDVNTDNLQTDASTYDPDGSAMSLLEFRAAQLRVNKLGSPAINEALADSMNIYAQLNAAKMIMEELGSMTTIYSDISAPEKIALATNRYPGILETYYGGSSGYNEFMQNLGSWLNDQKIIWASKADLLSEKDKYAASEETKIPLFVSEDSAPYKTLLVVGQDIKIAVGVDTTTNKAYVVWSGPTRSIDRREDFEIASMNPKNLVVKEIPTKTFSCYFFDPSLEENNLFLISTNSLGEIKWTNSLTAPNEPVSFRYDETLDQLTVFYYPEDQLPGEGVTAYIVIDRTGTVR